MSTYNYIVTLLSAPDTPKDLLTAFINNIKDMESLQAISLINNAIDVVDDYKQPEFESLIKKCTSFIQKGNLSESYSLLLSILNVKDNFNRSTFMSLFKKLILNLNNIADSKLLYKLIKIGGFDNADLITVLNSMTTLDDDNYNVLPLLCDQEYILPELLDAVLNSNLKMNFTTTGTNNLPPIVLLTYLGSQDYVEKLASLGADVNVTDSNGRTLLDHAKNCDHTHMVKVVEDLIAANNPAPVVPTPIVPVINNNPVPTGCPGPKGCLGPNTNNNTNSGNSPQCLSTGQPNYWCGTTSANIPKNNNSSNYSPVLACGTTSANIPKNNNSSNYSPVLACGSINGYIPNNNNPSSDVNDVKFKKELTLKDLEIQALKKELTITNKKLDDINELLSNIQ